MSESLSTLRFSAKARPAAEQLAELYFGSWRPRASKLLRSFGIELCDRDDLLQDAFVALLLNLERAERPEAYFLCAVRTRAIDRRRTQGRRTKVEIELESEAAPERYHANDRIDLARLLATLRSADRELLLDRFVLGRSHQEIVAEQGIADESVRKRQLRALSKLRQSVRSAMRTPAREVEISSDQHRCRLETRRAGQ